MSRAKVLAAASALLLAAGGAMGQIATLRITQVYGGGGFSTAPYGRDYVELFNYGPAPVDLSAFSIQHQPGVTGGFWTVRPLQGVVPPNSFFLVSLSPTMQSPGIELPVTPDFQVATNINASPGAGKLAIVLGQVRLDGCPPDFAAAGIVDMIGWGNSGSPDQANCFETAPATTLSEVIAAVRFDPCVDTDDNSFDFTFDFPNPRNSTVPGPGCAPISGADLAVTAAASNACPTVNDTVTYTITATNHGPDPAGGVVVTVELPGTNAAFIDSAPPLTPVGSTLVFPAGLIASGGSAVLTVNLSVTGGGVVPPLTAAVASGVSDFASYNNTAASAPLQAAGAPTGFLGHAIFNTRAGVASELPGEPGVQLGNNTNRPALRPAYSADRSRWTVVVDTNAGGGNSNIDEALLVGHGDTWITAAREGLTVMPTGEPLLALLGGCGVNNAGHYAFAAEDNTPGGSTNIVDKFVAKNVGAGLVLVARENDPAPSIADATYGDTFGSVSIQNDGTVSFYAALRGLTGPTDTAIFASDGAVKRAQEGTEIPTGQQDAGMMPTTFTYKSFDTDGYSVSASGAWATASTINSPTSVDRTLVVDNHVVVQEGLPVAGLPGVAGSGGAFVYGFMDPNGSWFAYGPLDNGQDWVLRNGTVLARTGDPITPGSTIHWSDARVAAGFFIATGDSLGNHVVGGYTDDTDTGADAVLVHNGTTVVAREGDPVDLNGDGLPNDDAYILAFHPNSAALADNGTLYFTVDLQTAANRCAQGTTATGHAFVRIQVSGGGASGACCTGAACAVTAGAGACSGAYQGDGTACGPAGNPTTCCPANFNQTGGVTVQDIFDFLGAYFSSDPSADFNGIGGVTVQDIFDFLAAYFSGC